MRFACVPRRLQPALACSTYRGHTAIRNARINSGQLLLSINAVIGENLYLTRVSVQARQDRARQFRSQRNGRSPSNAHLNWTAQGPNPRSGLARSEERRVGK